MDVATELPDVILSSKATTTTNQYSGAFNNWNSWAEKYGKTPLPADPYFVSIYLIHVSHSAKSPSPNVKVILAISWAHKLAGLQDPCSSPIIKQCAEGLKRKLACPSNKKEPITADILTKMVDMHCADKSVRNLLSLRTVTMSFVAFAGFLRFDELSRIKRGDIYFFDTHVH